jgi:hypothetical protein
MPNRLRIADLMIVVGLAGIGAFALIHDRDTLGVLVWALFMTALAIATLAARPFRSGGSTFWGAFAIFGWTWLVCGLRFGLLPSNEHLLLHSGIGLAFGFLAGYGARRLVTRSPGG